MAGEGASAAAQETQLHDGVHAQGDGGGHQHVQRPQPRRQGRLRPGLQRRPQGWPDRCHQEDGPAHFEAGRRRARVPGGDRHPEQARSPQPGHAHRLLRRRQAPVRRLRVHAQRQPPGHPQWHWGGEDGLAAAPADRAGRSAGAGLPALQHGRRRPRRPQGLQVQQHPPHRALRGKDLGLRARQAAAAGPGPAHDHQGAGHVRLLRPRIRADREADAAERRVRLRRGAAGAADGAASHRPQPGAAGAEPHRGDPPGGGRPQEAAQGGGPGHAQGLLHGGVRVHVRRARRALRLLRQRRPPRHAGLRQGAPVHHVRQHEDMMISITLSLRIGMSDLEGANRAWVLRRGACSAAAGLQL